MTNMRYADNVVDQLTVEVVDYKKEVFIVKAITKNVIFCLSCKGKKIFWRTDVKYFDFFIHSVNSHLQ